MVCCRKEKIVPLEGRLERFRGLVHCDVRLGKSNNYPQGDLPSGSIDVREMCRTSFHGLHRPDSTYPRPCENHSESGLASLTLHRESI